MLVSCVDGYEPHQQAHKHDHAHASPFEDEYYESTRPGLHQIDNERIAGKKTAQTVLRKPVLMKRNSDKKISVH